MSAVVLPEWGGEVCESENSKHAHTNERQDFEPPLYPVLYECLMKVEKRI